MSTLRILVAFVLLTLGTISAWGQSDCIRARIALDIGSGSTKMKSAVVDVCHQKILAIILTPKKVHAEFLNNLHRDHSDGGFDQAFLDSTVPAITAAVTKLKADSADKLRSDATLSQYSNLADSDMEVAGVATEAFRESNNTDTFVQMMAQQRITVYKIPQRDEGRVGFLSVYINQSVDVNSFMSWDIGNGSLQMAAYNNSSGKGTWNDVDDRLAAIPMQLNLLQFKNVPATTPDGKPVSPNPLLPYGQLAKKQPLLVAAENFVKNQSPSPTTEGAWVYSRMHSNQPLKVYGLGGVHQGVLAVLNALPAHATDTSYTRRDLEVLLDDVLFASDSYMHNRYKVDDQYTGASVSNIVLVYTVMKILGIDEVTPVDVDNTLGTMITPKYWNPAPVQGTNLITWE